MLMPVSSSLRYIASVAEPCNDVVLHSPGSDLSEHEFIKIMSMLVEIVSPNMFSRILIEAYLFQPHTSGY